jgi:hypothetical protein
VPTPFYHIHFALDLLKQPEMDSQARQLLERQRCHFLLGNTAPDVQVLSGDKRETTHFFALPFQANAPRPWQEIFENYPSLARASQLPESQASFVAGYLCHLQADWLWVKDIFAPVFGPTCSWSSFNQRLYLHNVLRAYLDRQVFDQLPEDIGACLLASEPRGWLPFAQDLHLVKWRNYLAEQLRPGALAETVQVFAERQGIAPKEYLSLLNSEEKMEVEVFTRLPRQRLLTYRQDLLKENVILINSYLSGL